MGGKPLEFSDDQLVKEALDGSAVAFERLVARYEKLVYKIAFSCFRQRESTLDVLQNVFLKVHSKLSSFRTEGDFRNWIARITVNESINWKRSQKRHQASELDEAMMLASPAEQERQLQDRETWELLRQSMETLKPINRTAIALRYFEGMSIREAANVLGCSEANIKSILFRSLKQMRQHMGITKEIEL
jgi:RNA polymerase sigma-70 factor (ECF subfamily)